MMNVLHCSTLNACSLHVKLKVCLADFRFSYPILIAGVLGIPIPFEVARKFLGEDTLDSRTVSILHYLLEVALGSDKICSAVRPTGTRLSA